MILLTVSLDVHQEEALRSEVTALLDERMVRRHVATFVGVPVAGSCWLVVVLEPAERVLMSS